jgi:hypothetical protein
VTASIISRALIALAGFKIASLVRRNGFVHTSAGPVLTGSTGAYRLRSWTHWPGRPVLYGEHVERRLIAVLAADVDG